MLEAQFALGFVNRKVLAFVGNGRETYALALLALGLGNAVIGQGCQAKAIT
jgi:hypothetical protein